MEIKEQLVYIVDNVQFTNKDEAIKFAKKYEKVDEIMSILEPRTKDVDYHKKILKHDIKTLKECLHNFLLYASKEIDFNVSTDFFDNVEQDVLYKTKRSSAYICKLDNYIFGNNNLKFLKEPFYRFKCINFISGCEYSQPFYVFNEKEAFEILNNNL